ncbi:MAG: HEAT repeat domain-containing protein [Planctomycetota bacterium]
MQISVFPPLLEILTVECGRSGLPSAVPVLLGILKGGQEEGRAEACLALGAFGGKEAVRALLDALTDNDGWVRFTAYRALRALSGQDFFCRWVFGSREAHGKAAKQYRDWFAAHPPKAPKQAKKDAPKEPPAPPAAEKREEKRSTPEEILEKYRKALLGYRGVVSVALQDGTIVVLVETRGEADGLRLLVGPAIEGVPVRIEVQ